MMRIDMAWSPQKNSVPEPSFKSSSGSRGGCGTGFRALLCIEQMGGLTDDGAFFDHMAWHGLGWRLIEVVRRSR